MPSAVSTSLFYQRLYSGKCKCYSKKTNMDENFIFNPSEIIQREIEGRLRLFALDAEKEGQLRFEQKEIILKNN
ncbi:MAG: hypothetical protein NVS9B7_22000 [Flavisolibacter sp.]